MATQQDTALVSCVRCAVWAAHPFAELPRTCPNCGRIREVRARD